jgi:hypothetical protein
MFPRRVATIDLHYGISKAFRALKRTAKVRPSLRDEKARISRKNAGNDKALCYRLLRRLESEL